MLQQAQPGDSPDRACIISVRAATGKHSDHRSDQYGILSGHYLEIIHKKTVCLSLFVLLIMIAGLEQNFIENLSDLDSLRISWSGAEKLHIGWIVINQHRYSNLYTLHKGGHHLI